MSEHAPLPWSYRPVEYDDWGWIRASDGTLAATARGHDEWTHDQHRSAGTDPYGPNAAFIVKAVNSHDALVRALEGIAEFSSGDDTTLGALSRLASIRNTALNVLAHVGTPEND